MEPARRARGKRTAVVAGTGCLILLALVAWSCADAFREAWWLWRLEGARGPERDRLIADLSNSGAGLSVRWCLRKIAHGPLAEDRALGRRLLLELRRVDPAAELRRAIRTMDATDPWASYLYGVALREADRGAWVEVRGGATLLHDLRAPAPSETRDAPGPLLRAAGTRDP